MLPQQRGVIIQVISVHEFIIHPLGGLQRLHRRKGGALDVHEDGGARSKNRCGHEFR